MQLHSAVLTAVWKPDATLRAENTDASNALCVINRYFNIIVKMIGWIGMEKISFEQNQPTPAALQTQPKAQSNAFAQTLAKENSMAKKQNIFLPLLVVIIFAGIGTGYVAASMTSKSAPVVTQTTTSEGEQPSEETTPAVKVGQVVGAKDASAFKDSAEGVLVAGGVGGEGSHHIVRPGGVSQSVYLTSSVMDLKEYEGHKVKVYGETFKAQKAGWLMDVGRLEVKELNAELPDGAKKPAEDLMQDE